MIYLYKRANNALGIMHSWWMSGTIKLSINSTLPDLTLFFILFAFTKTKNNQQTSAYTYLPITRIEQ